MGIVLPSIDRALPAPPLRLRRDTIPPHDPSGPFADHPCLGITRLLGNDSATEQGKSSGSGPGICSLTTLTPRQRHQHQQSQIGSYRAEDDRMSAYLCVTN